MSSPIPYTFRQSGLELESKSRFIVIYYLLWQLYGRLAKIYILYIKTFFSSLVTIISQQNE